MDTAAFCSVNSARYAADDDQKLYDTEVIYPYPKFYKPTWKELFDHVARQTTCAWSWDPKNRQFKFERAENKPLFHLTLADGWRSEDRGLYVWHAPKGRSFGMDIYYLGHYTTPADDPDFARKVREHVAMMMIAGWPDGPKVKQMTAAKVAGQEALHLKVDTPRPGGVWRQWSVLVDGQAFLIVSAMPKTSEAEVAPAVEKMVESFSVETPATQPANKR